MRLTLPDASHPTQSVTYDYPDAPVVALLTWLLALPVWQRSPQRLSERLQDFRLELATLRATGGATRVGDPPIEIRATTPSATGPMTTGPDTVAETPGQARARRMREAKAAKRAAAP